MSAALPRAQELKHGTDELTQPAETNISGKLESVFEVATVAGADLASISNHGATSLMRAACDGSAGTVRALLDRGVEVNAKRSDGLNALALAAFFGHSQIVWLLLENGADLVATGRSNTLPEMWADARGFVDVGDIIREARATRPVEATHPGTAVIDEPACFPRSAEKEGPQPTNVHHSGAECSLIDEASDSETTLVRPAPSEQCTSGESEPTGNLPNAEPEPTQEQPLLTQALRAGGAEMIDESTDSGITLVRPAPATEGNSGTESSSTINVVTDDSPQQVQEQPVVRQPQRVLRTLPEIQDPPPLVVPEFHPGSAFVARITSSRKNLVALVLIVWLACGGTAYFLIPQVRKSFAFGPIEAGTRTKPVVPLVPLVKEPSATVVAGSSTSVSSTVETAHLQTTESTTANASKEIGEPTAVIPADGPSNREGDESTSAVRSVEASEKGPAVVAAASSSERRANPRSTSSFGDSVAEPSENKTEVSPATSMSRSSAPARKQRAVSRAVKFKQQKVTEEQPKPAPLSVEVSGSSSVPSAPARSANDASGSQSPPLNIISGKPKPKVIQWP